MKLLTHGGGPGLIGKDTEVTDVFISQRVAATRRSIATSVSASGAEKQGEVHPRFAGKPKRQELGSGRFRPVRPKPAGPHDTVLFQVLFSTVSERASQRKL